MARSGGERQRGNGEQAKGQQRTAGNRRGKSKRSCLGQKRKAGTGLGWPWHGLGWREAWPGTVWPPGPETYPGNILATAGRQARSGRQDPCCGPHRDTKRTQRGRALEPAGRHGHDLAAARPRGANNAPRTHPRPKGPSPTADRSAGLQARPGAPNQGEVTAGPQGDCGNSPRRGPVAVRDGHRPHGTAARRPRAAPSTRTALPLIAQSSSAAADPPRGGHTARREAVPRRCDGTTSTWHLFCPTCRTDRPRSRRRHFVPQCTWPTVGVLGVLDARLATPRGTPNVRYAHAARGARPPRDRPQPGQPFKHHNSGGGTAPEVSAGRRRTLQRPANRTLAFSSSAPGNAAASCLLAHTRAMQACARLEGRVAVPLRGGRPHGPRPRRGRYQAAALKCVAARGTRSRRGAARGVPLGTAAGGGRMPSAAGEKNAARRGPHHPS